MTVENTGPMVRYNMRTATIIQRGAASNRRRQASDLRRVFTASAMHAWSARRDNYMLTATAVPLAMTATGLLGQWMAWPVLLAAVAACSPGWRWSWLFSLELAFVSTDWAYVGTVWLGGGSVLPIGIVWATFPLALAGAGAWNRYRTNRPEAYFPLYLRR